MRRTPDIAAVVAVLALCGCGHPVLSPSPTVPPPTTSTLPPTTTTTISPELGVARFENCVRREGLDIGPIPLDGQGRPRLELALARFDFTITANAAALTTCSQHLTTGALGLGGQSLVGDEVREMLALFSQCVRSVGLPGFPDPVPGSDGVGPPYPVGEIPFHEPGLATAVKVCRTRMGG